jgi:hypothetical protein
MVKLQRKRDTVDQMSIESYDPRQVIMVSKFVAKRVVILTVTILTDR